MITFTTEIKPSKEKNKIIVYLNTSLKRSITLSKDLFLKNELNTDSKNIETASGSKTNLIMYEPVLSKKTENELYIVELVTDPESVIKLIKIGNNIAENLKTESINSETVL